MCFGNSLQCNPQREQQGPVFLFRCCGMGVRSSIPSCQERALKLLERERGDSLRALCSSSVILHRCGEGWKEEVVPPRSACPGEGELGRGVLGSCSNLLRRCPLRAGACWECQQSSPCSFYVGLDRKSSSFLGQSGALSSWRNLKLT